MDDRLRKVGVGVRPLTVEDIAAGRAPNGSDDLAIANAYRKGRQVAKAENELGRRKAYEDEMRDSLKRIAELEKRLLGVADELMGRLEAGDEVSRQDVALLKTTLGAAKEMKDRAMGKPTARTEVSGGVGVLHALINAGRGEAGLGIGLDADVVDVPVLGEGDVE